jgi:hypothetical protein
MTDIERERAETIMRNSQVFQSLGITRLAAAVNNSTTKSKGKAREESDPLYEPENMEETGDAVLDEVSAIKLLRIHKLIAVQTSCAFYHWDFI